MLKTLAGRVAPKLWRAGSFVRPSLHSASRSFATESEEEYVTKFTVPGGGAAQDPKMAAFRDAFLQLDKSMTAEDAAAKRKALAEEAGVPEPTDAPPSGAVFLTEDLYLSSNSLTDRNREAMSEEEISKRLAQIESLGLNFADTDSFEADDIDCPYPEFPLLEKIAEKQPALKNLPGHLPRPPFTDIFDTKALEDSLKLVAEKTKYTEAAINSLAEDYKKENFDPVLQMTIEVQKKTDQYHAWRCFAKVIGVYDDVQKGVL